MSARAFASGRVSLAIGLGAAIVSVTMGSSWATTPTASPSDSPAVAETSAWRTVVSKFAQDHFNNPAWGYSHSRRDYQLARELAAADHVTLDDDVLYAAAYLHDM